MLQFLKKNLSIIFLLSISLVFFYKFFLLGLVPFPGDLLMGNYEPYRSNSELGLTTAAFPHKGQGGDVIRELYPWKHLSIEMLKKGVFPLWNPYVFSGNPQFANLQSGALYPVNILFFIMPFISAWSLYIVLQYVFMLLFMYLYLRQIKLSIIASILGSISFSFSHFMIVWGWYGNLGHALAFLPLILFSIEKILENRKTRWYLVLILSFTFSIFAGYIQFTLYIYMLAGIYVLSKFFAEGRKELKTYILIILSFLASILLSAVQLVPLFEFVSQSLRANYSYEILSERLMPPISVITLLIPDFFGNPATHNYFLQGGSSLERASAIGVWPLIFAVFALFSKRSFYKYFFLIFAFISYISTFSFAPITFFHSIGIPFLSTGIPTRILSAFGFCLSVAAAIGVDSYLRYPKIRGRMNKIILLFAFIFLSILIGTYFFPEANMDISRRNMIIPGFIFLAGSILLFLKVPKKIALAVIVLLTVAELFYSFQKFNSFVPKGYVYPETYVVQKLQEIQGVNRYWGYGSANIDANFQMIDHTYTTAGYDALYLKRYGEFIAASGTGEVPNEIPRSVADILPGFGTSELKENPYRKRALDLTGVKYVLNRKNEPEIDSAFDESYFTLVWQDRGWQIYENINVLPRVKMFGVYVVSSDSKKIVPLLYSPGFDFQNSVVLEKNIPVGFDIQKDSSSSAEVKKYTENEIEIMTSSSQDQLLFISDNYYPGWKALVDGKEAEVYQANYTFRAVPVKKGNHTIKMYFDPPSFRAGVYISAGTFAALILIFLFVTIKKRHA